MSTVQKETIYIDVDDEITGVIGKVRRSPRKIIALVLPKRATVFQSVVNMKLLKREAEEGKKSIVLITSESALLPLAGAAGLHVAKTLSSKPVIPVSPTKDLAAEENETDDVEIDSTKSVGDLTNDLQKEESIDVDYGDDEKIVADDNSKGKKPNKKLKIPNFERFRLMVALGGGLLVLLLVGLFWALVIAPKAKVTIKTDTTSVDTTLDFIASLGTKTLDQSKLLVPAIITENKKTDTQKVPATGEKDNGDKATGTITLYDCSDNDITVPAGTVLKDSVTGYAFSTNQDVAVPASNFFSNGSCKKDESASVSVTSTEGGGKFNLSARSYTSTINGVSGYGSNMTGGTTKLVKAVSQLDVDTAKQQVLDRLKIVAGNELKKQLSDQNMVVLNDSLTVGNPVVSANPAVGAEGSDTIVTVSVTFTITAITQENLKPLIEEDVKQKIDPTKQAILEKDRGLGKAIIKLGEKAVNGDIKVNLQTTVTAGPQLDTEAIKKEVAGKKKGDAQTIIKKRPGIKEVRIDYSPFWVMSTPKKTSKITVVFEKSSGGN